ncbi:hypothetical protein BJX66DRAFT_33989 [Aspergillus keveii]|uniref:Uncharacterized protein n=1 Tax=Aspergillus keveii TaxID=714993 RepID=A0ABR4GHJ0_9EURO
MGGTAALVYLYYGPQGYDFAIFRINDHFAIDHVYKITTEIKHISFFTIFQFVVVYPSKRIIISTPSLESSHQPTIRSITLSPPPSTCAAVIVTRRLYPLLSILLSSADTTPSTFRPWIDDTTTDRQCKVKWCESLSASDPSGVPACCSLAPCFESHSMRDAFDSSRRPSRFPVWRVFSQARTNQLVRAKTMGWGGGAISYTPYWPEASLFLNSTVHRIAVRARLTPFSLCDGLDSKPMSQNTRTNVSPIWLAGSRTAVDSPQTFPRTCMG